MLRLPFISATERYPFCSNHVGRPSISVRTYAGPWRSRADAVMVTSAPTRSSLSTSSGVSTPVDAASEIDKCGRNIAIHARAIAVQCSSREPISCGSQGYPARCLAEGIG